MNDNYEDGPPERAYIPVMDYGEDYYRPVYVVVVKPKGLLWGLWKIAQYVALGLFGVGIAMTLVILLLVLYIQ